MAKVIDIKGLHKSFGSTHALDGLDLEVAPARCTASSARTARASPPPSGCCSACCAPTPATVGCSAATRGATPPTLHRRLAYVPGDVNLWPNLSGGEVIDLLGRLRGGLDEQRRARPDRALRARPDQEGPDLLQGQPAEGRAGRRPGLRRRAAGARRADLRARPADGGRLPASASTRSSNDGAHRAAVQPHPRRGRAAVRPGEHHPRRPHRRERHPRRAAPPHPHLDPRRAGRAGASGLDALRGVHDLVVEGHRVSFEVDTDAPGRGPAGAAAGSASGRSPASRRPSRSCSSGTTATRSRRQMTARDRSRHAAAYLRPEGPVDAPVVRPRGDRPLLVAGGRASTASTPRRRSSTGPPRAWRTTRRSSR